MYYASTGYESVDGERSAYVIMAESGLSWQVKRSALARKVARRRLNMGEKA